MTNAPDKPYWAALPSEEFAGELTKRIDGYYDYVKRSGRLTLWRTLHELWHAGAKSLGQLGAGGQQGELTVLCANHLRNIGMHTVNLITAQRPAFDAKASTTDYESEVQCQLAQSILDYDMRAKRLEDVARQVVEYAVQSGEGWGLKTWDTSAGEPWGIDPTTGQPTMSGSLRYSAFHPLDVARDPYRELSAPRTWAAPRRWENRYDLVARLKMRAQEKEAEAQAALEQELAALRPAPGAVEPDPVVEAAQAAEAEARIAERQAQHAAEAARRAEDLQKLIDAVMKAPRRSEVVEKHYILGYDRVLDTFEEDDCEVFEFYHARTEALPDGRRCLLVGGVVIEDGPLPYRRLPLFPLRAGSHAGTCFGYSITFDLAPIQKAIDALVSTIASNQAAFGVQSILVPKGHGLEVTQLSTGLQAISFDPGLGPPVPLQLTKTAPETFAFLTQLVAFMETLSGISSVVRGDPQASLKSGSALAMVASQALQFTVDIQAAYVLFLEDITTAAVEDYQDFATIPQVALLAGKSNLTRMKEWKGSDIARVTRVLVDIGNALSKTLAGRSEMATQLVQAGLVKDAQTYVEVLTTGRLEAVTGPSLGESLLIKAENEAISEVQPPSEEAIAAAQQQDQLAAEQAIAQGLPPPPPTLPALEGVPQALATDDHPRHILGHKDLVASPGARENPTLTRAALEHIQQHIDLLRTTDPLLLAALGIPVPPDNVAAQGAPPPGEEMPPGPPGSGDPTYVPPMPSMPQMPKNPATGQRETAPVAAPTPPGAKAAA